MSGEDTNSGNHSLNANTVANEIILDDEEQHPNRIDMRAFFRDVERGSRSFLAQYDRQAKQNQSLFPYYMSRDAWWREFLKWAGKNETR